VNPPDRVMNEKDCCDHIKTFVMRCPHSGQENGNDFVKPDGFDDENEYGAFSFARYLSSFNS